MSPVDPAAYLSARSALVQRLGHDAVAAMGTGELEDDLRAVHALQAEAETLAGWIEQAKLQLAALRAECQALAQHPADHFAPGAAPLAQGRLEEAERRLQGHRRALQGLANISRESGFFPLSPRVRAALAE